MKHIKLYICIATGILAGVSWDLGFQGVTYAAGILSFISGFLYVLDS